MTSVAAAYDTLATRYAELFLHGLDEDVQSRRGLDRFAQLAAPLERSVVDVGCGPGGAVRHLRALGLDAIGCDVSVGQLTEARAAFPDLPVLVGDLTSLPHPDGSLGGVVSKYSIIHLVPSELRAAFAEWRRVLVPGAPVFVSFFGSRSAGAHGTPFDHAVATAYELWPATIDALLQTSGFVDVEIEATPIPEGGRPFDHTTILARQSWR